MTNRTNPVRRHSRFPVSWPVLYGNAALLAEGTVLDLTPRGWRVMGSMPVTAGMQLTLQVFVPERSIPLCVHRATVLWVQDHEFAIEAHEMPPIDQAWVTEFLHQKLGLMWMSQTTKQATPPQAGDKALPCRETGTSRHSVPSIEDVLRRFLEIETDLPDKPVETQWDSEVEFQESEVHTSCDAVPEKIWREARRILRRMVAIKADSIRTSQDLITGN